MSWSYTGLISLFFFIIAGTIFQSRELRSFEQPRSLALAILGDSGTTGVLNGGQVQATAESLESLAGAVLREDFQPRRNRVFYSTYDYDQSFWWRRYYLKWVARAGAQMDAPDSAFGFRLGHFLGLSPDDMLLVGQDGQKIEALPEQFRRLGEVSKHLPPLVLISFTANDFCHPDFLKLSETQTHEHFETQLSRAWEASRDFLKPHPQGTRILVLAPFEILNLLNNPDVLSTQIKLEGRERATCENLLQAPGKFSVKSWFVHRTLNAVCPTVTRVRQNRGLAAADEGLKKLEKIQEVLNKAWEAQIQTLQRSVVAPDLRFEYIKSTREIAFTKGDVASDCFHPSATGHEKIARALQSYLESHP